MLSLEALYKSVSKEEAVRLSSRFWAVIIYYNNIVSLFILSGRQQIVKISKVPHDDLVGKATERDFKTIVNYIENPRLLLAQMFLLLTVTRDISDPPSQYLVNPRDPRTKNEEIKEKFQNWNETLQTACWLEHKGPAAVLLVRKPDRQAGSKKKKKKN